MTKDEIQQIIDINKVVVFMKGTRDLPACGFSALVVQIFQNLNVSFKDIDVMKDAELRQNIKEFSSWPTLPQIYINGEFIGGCDILREMYQTGELKEILKENITIS